MNSNAAAKLLKVQVNLSYWDLKSVKEVHYTCKRDTTFVQRWANNPPNTARWPLDVLCVHDWMNKHEAS